MKKGFTLVELLAVLSLVALLGVIIYPKLTNIIEKNKEKAFKESVKATIRSYNSYLASENYPDIGEVDITLGIIPTIKESDWKAGVIIQKEDGIYLENLYNGKFCAYGDEDSFTVTKGKCQITPTSCYAFDENTKTITGYKNRSTCGSIVDIPSQINGVNVEHIGREAFYDRGIESLKLPNSLLSIEGNAIGKNQLSEILIPENVSYIHLDAFLYEDLSKIKINKSENSISGAPWGAKNAIVEWLK